MIEWSKGITPYCRMIGYLALGICCLIAGLIWTVATGVWRQIPVPPIDDPWVDSTYESEPDHLRRSALL